MDDPFLGQTRRISTEEQYLRLPKGSKEKTFMKKSEAIFVKGNQ
jgi:hypothetical protein